MTEIVRGDGMKYVLAYNAYHNLESIGVNGKDEKLVQYTYKTGNGRLKEIAYANGDTMKATYNSIGQMIAEKWYNGSNTLTAHYKYVYDGQGNIVRSIDITALKEYNYYYEDGKIMRATECDITLDGEIVTAKVLVNSILYSYDEEDRMTKKRIIPADGTEQIIYYENNEDNTIVKFSAGGKTVTSHSKTDSFGRKVFDELQLGTGFVSRQFTYHTGEVTEEHQDHEKLKSTATTQLVSQIVLSDGRTLSYEYDAEERITKVIDSEEGTTVYTYDAMGQLLTETKDGVLVNSMTYDHYGNILSKNGEQYCYDEGWKDRLTCFGSRCIEYDAQGNPTQYLGHTLTWEKGRQLKSYDNIQFTYNANGIRTSKTIDGVKHTYTLDGTKILRETWGENTLIPLYDNEDSVCGIIFNDAPYYFQKNLQGDVIAIADCNAKVVAKYSYDAWGKCSITCDSSCDCDCIAEINPFRYRSYYFDRQTNLYYLQSRYYDPEVGRFLNSDEERVVVLAGEKQLGNLFVYCDNDPTNSDDGSGLLSFNSIKKNISSFISKLFNKFKNYVKNLVTYENRVLTIQTVVISAAIDTFLFVLGSVASFLARKALFKVVKSILFKNKETTSNFMKWLIDLCQKINVVRLILWAISVKTGAYAVKVKSYLSDFTQNILRTKHKILDLYFKILSLTSFSGIIAFLIDLMDGKPDDQIRIKI